jgi:hypothetical protein
MRYVRLLCAELDSNTIFDGTLSDPLFTLIEGGGFHENKNLAGVVLGYIHRILDDTAFNCCPSNLERKY